MCMEIVTLASILRGWLFILVIVTSDLNETVLVLVALFSELNQLTPPY